MSERGRNRRREADIKRKLGETKNWVLKDEKLYLMDFFCLSMSLTSVCSQIKICVIVVLVFLCVAFKFVLPKQ